MQVANKETATCFDRAVQMISALVITTSSSGTS
jgi:hypothetical protein